MTLFVGNVPVHVASVWNTEFNILQLTTGLRQWLHEKDEGVHWLRGHHADDADDSAEVKAALTARALVCAERVWALVCTERVFLP